MSSSDSEESQGVQVRVCLKLAKSVQDRSLEVPTEPIAVPADIGRQGLSAVLNHLLGRSVKRTTSTGDESSDDDENSDDDDVDKLPALSFEFMLTNNKLLRKGVEKEARQHGIGLEEAIQITYFPAAKAPELLDDDEKLPDWVSCLSLVVDNNQHDQHHRLISGCYDGSLNIYQCNTNDKTGDVDGLEKIYTTIASSGPIKCLQTVSVDDISYIASASLDHTLSIHTVSDDEKGSLELYGYCQQQEGISSAMSSLDFFLSSSGNNEGILLAGGDGNGSINIWDITKGENIVEPTKKRKTSSTEKGNINATKKTVAPSITIESAHSQLISGISWGNHHHLASNNEISNHQHRHLISSSWDHSIKLWDVQRQDCLLTLNGSRVVSCMDTSYHSEGVVATGHPDCTIRLWDVRINNDTKQSATIISDNHTFRPSHRGWVSTVKWNKSNAYQLASSSHDGTIKLWDIRSSNPLYTVRAFPKEEKALCLVWGEGGGAGNQNNKENADGKYNSNVIFTGGTDCLIKQLRV